MPAVEGNAHTLVRRRREPPAWQYRDLLIRRYVPADHAAVLELHRQGLAQVGLRPGDGVYYEHDLFRIEEVYFDRCGEFVVGERDGVVVAMGGLRRADLIPTGLTRAHGGYAVGLPPRTEIAEMVRLRVHQTVRRRGYGSAIVAALEERAVELGYRLLHCDTTDLQVAAMELYRRAGWRETRREVIGGITNVYFEKALF
ncbi:GNAT family N-acetyltransferase [Thermomonospora curvata]|uniref:GCN5-related N-acetyltransferase n=1 Tax=Thermomonospora curvata (strain ATCC 19995 / DSM 43183 / JCM 3096 / KCTC 9072 / NBRC 15933 / NCIMB 10081 / Henssen B9) TaxID=471852 RepID=D1A9Y3_THECD|nr:GNAT family N-acetyltransferase [Thermomonospora curvata]ACY96919.1 GCN5-related N-acetyltransferase [Thermomonospora curvata DSM 43183]PKK15199.1 MAG: N-acetyltransferase [Thermomonospora sp. CIF 1]